VKAVSAQLRPGWSLFAHSMGGLVSISSIQDGLAPARFALSNPLLGVRVKAPALKISAAKILSKVWPTLGLTNELDPSMLSRDASVGKAYAADPLVYDKITPRWYTEMLAAQLRALTVTRFPMPTQFFLSDADPICDPVAAERLAKAAGCPVKLYPGMLHELVNEIGKEQVIGDIATFLEGA
jgi:alpha-beta hydrolase superfamily lysophospholipase